MGPKKNQITASTPAVANPSATFGGISDNSGPSTINESSFVIGNVEDVVLKQPTISKASTLDLVCKAIETVGVPRKGASYMAIQKWIINNKENASVKMLKANMKKAIVKALESGLLKRPAASKNVTGLRGYFIMNKEVKIPKPKTATAAKPKGGVKSKSNTEEATSTKPKTKAEKSKPNTEEATSAKPKTKAVKSKPNTEEATSTIPKTKAAKSKSNTEEATSAKPKTKSVKSKSNTEETTSANPKIKAVKSKSDTKKATSAKPKTKAVKSKSDTESSSSGKAKTDVKSNPGKKGPKATAAKSIPDSEDLPIPKPKAVRSRVNGVKVPTQEELNSVQIPPKVPKNISKPRNSAKDKSNDHRPRKLYTSRVSSTTNISRKDLSDTELNVKPDNRKSLKSYSSDTEVEVIRKKVSKVTKTKKNAGTKKT